MNLEIQTMKMYASESLYKSTWAVEEGTNKIVWAHITVQFWL